MDTLTHGLAGALLGRAGARRENAKAMAAVGSIAAMVPDLDAFFLPGSWFSLGDTMNYLRYHRGPSHSFLLAPFFAVGIALIARIFARRTPLPFLWTAALAGIVSHILFDWITSYGTMFFAPLSWHRYSLDWVFILDPYFTGIPIAALILALCFPARGRAVAAGGSLLLFFYIGLCAAAHFRAIAAARRLFPGAKVSALPQPFSPRRWVLFAIRGDAVDVAYVRLGGAPPSPLKSNPPPHSRFLQIVGKLKESYASPEAPPIERFPTEERAREVIAARTFPEVASWREFARFPVATVEELPKGGSRVTFTDLRFRGPWGPPAFEYEVLMDPAGKVRAAGFVRLFVTQRANRRK